MKRNSKRGQNRTEIKGGKKVYEKIVSDRETEKETFYCRVDGVFQRKEARTGQIVLIKRGPDVDSTNGRTGRRTELNRPREAQRFPLVPRFREFSAVDRRNRPLE